MNKFGTKLEHYLTGLSTIPVEHRKFFEKRNETIRRAWKRTDGKLTRLDYWNYFLRVGDYLYTISFNPEREVGDRWDVFIDCERQRDIETYPTLAAAKEALTD